MHIFRLALHWTLAWSITDTETSSEPSIRLCHPVTDSAFDPVRRDGREKESETPRCQAKGLARPQGRGRTRALTAGAMGSGVGQRNGVASADASVATADRVAFPRVCCPRLRPSSPADSPSSSRYPSPALR